MLCAVQTELILTSKFIFWMIYLSVNDINVDIFVVFALFSDFLFIR